MIEIKQIKIFQSFNNDVSGLEYSVNRWLSKHSPVIIEFSTSFTYTPTGCIAVVSYKSESFLEVSKKP